MADTQSTHLRIESSLLNNHHTSTVSLVFVWKLYWARWDTLHSGTVDSPFFFLSIFSTFSKSGKIILSKMGKGKKFTLCVCGRKKRANFTFTHWPWKKKRINNYLCFTRTIWTKNKKTKMSSRIVLLACGSFNPPHYLHARIFEVAKNYLARRNQTVVHGWLSPVSDGYGKPGLGMCYFIK